MRPTLQLTIPMNNVQKNGFATRMKHKFDWSFIPISMYILLVCFVCFVVVANVYGLLTTELADVKGKVHSHHVSTNRSGTKRHYMTVIQTEDGWIQEKEGLSYYVLPVGSNVTIQMRKKK